jgi:hypothetical protein
MIVRLLTLCWMGCVFVLLAQGCTTTNRSVLDAQQQAAIAAQKEGIVNRLVPEDGLTFTRRARLIDATIAVLGKGDREELSKLNYLRSTLHGASLENLQRIEANYKERLADGE